MGKYVAYNIVIHPENGEGSEIIPDVKAELHRIGIDRDQAGDNGVQNVSCFNMNGKLVLALQFGRSEIVTMYAYSAVQQLSEIPRTGDINLFRRAIKNNLTSFKK
ncbi:MAG: hypothetical protein OEY64_10185 [Nitrospinota bacterium]|nr:hypothetical protein [Nitrospinota bacterium]